MRSTRKCFYISWALIFVMGLIVGCDDPRPGPVGGLVLAIRSFEAMKDADLMAIRNIEIQTARVEVQHVARLGDNEQFLTVDTQPRTISIVNEGQTDLLVAQYPVPPGYVSQIRIFPSAVTLHLKNGDMMPLGVPSSDVPSWAQSGWKLQPVDGNPWPIVQDELTGIRVLFSFDDRMLHNKGDGYKIKPTSPADIFDINPPSDGPGIFGNQLTVVFKEGVTRLQVEGINSQIGASIRIAPVIGTAYRIKLPGSTNLQDGFNFYKGRDEVHAVLPAINYSPFELQPGEHINDPNLSSNGLNFDSARFNLAWEEVNRQLGRVGSRKVRIAVIDTGVAMRHRDLYENIAINFDEIPIAYSQHLQDVERDDVISFIDLNQSVNAAWVPPDINNNGYIDGQDLIAPHSPWLDQVDNDGNTFVDDLVGWNFSESNNDPSNDPTDKVGHGTLVAGLAGAVGNNNTGIAGAAWVVSIVPIRITGDVHFSPDAYVIQAFQYAERLGIDIVNFSYGHNFASSRTSHCTPGDSMSTLGKSPEVFDQGVAEYIMAFQRPPWTDLARNPTPRALYVFASGNSGLNLSDPNVKVFPAQPMKAAIGGNALIVGAYGFPNQTGGNFGNPVINSPIEIYAQGGNWQSLSYQGGNTSGPSLIGSSFAAPVVAGAAALFLATHPGTFPPYLIHDRIVNGAMNGVVSLAPCGQVIPGMFVPALDAFNVVR